MIAVRVIDACLFFGTAYVALTWPGAFVTPACIAFYGLVSYAHAQVVAAFWTERP